jgi:outer membrane protein TolC
VHTSADFRSAVPNGEVTPEVLPLTFLDAIDRALKYNLAMVSGDLDIRQTRTQRLQTLADLLPSVSVRPSVNEQQTSLAAFGFTGFPGVPPILGPFTVVDARAILSTPVVDLKTWRRYKAGAEDIKAAQLNYQDARDEVVLVATSLYLYAVAGASRIESARAQVTVSEALYHQASDRKEAGTAPAIDVIRAEVEWKQQQQRLISYEGEFEKQKLALARAIGLPLAQKFSLADPMPYDPIPTGFTAENLLDLALRQRPDYLAKQAEVRGAELRKQSAAAGRLPTVSFDANYGVIGARIDEVHGTFGVAGSVNIPLYQGGRVQADVASADADLQHRKSELDALRARIDAEVRAALLDARTASRLVEVSKGNVDLARQQLEQSRDRFADGVTNNVEVVQAQQALTAAEESYIASLFSFNAAKTQVARARGDAGKSVIEYLKGKR